ncbi:protein-tyrosine phosphatase [Oscillochloris trichoides DG-6]|uniref:Protein-tyrosine phosphatase n=1 Tax=Oscillochloris trichoides DG-6 TaxID=765420 RepID=E1IB74_9CHLR|nr:dual specificity protein phosphatase family protein [Oscillochloris trichoides]EFO81559.1 protein-tyrosine phosphatase [Oscillochloris trichoides DG-6]
MQPMVYWFTTPVGGRLGTLPHPRGGALLAEEMAALRADGVDVLISLLGQPEQEDSNLEAEPNLAQAAGMEFRSLPIFDFATPPLDSTTAAFIAAIVDDLKAGRSVAIHCWMGVGRSSTIAAGVLGVLGLEPDEAFGVISAARGQPVPDTMEQWHWVERFIHDWAHLRPKHAELS